MAQSGGRSFLASVVGWILVAIVVWFLFGGILSAIRFVVRLAVFVLIVGALLVLYFRLRDGD